MASHGCDDDFDIVDADDSRNKYDFYAMRRALQQPASHMTQQMTTKVAPAYDRRTSFFAFEDVIDDRCDITELEPEKRGPALRNRLEGEASQHKIRLNREVLRDPSEGAKLFRKILATPFHQGSPSRVLISIHAAHEAQQRHNGLTKFQLTGHKTH